MPINGAQLGSVLAVVTEGLLNGSDVGVAFKDHPDIAVVVSTSDPNYSWVHRITPTGGRSASLTSHSLLKGS